MRQTVAPTDRLGRAPFVLSGLLAIDAIVATLASLARPDLIHGPAASIGSLRGTALVVLVVGVPLLAASMALVRRGSLLALLGWLGVLAYISYQGVLFLFGSPFNGLFFGYLGILSFGVWALIALVPRLPVGDIAARFGPRTPTRLVAGYLVVVAGLFYVLWLRAIVPALFDSTSPGFLEGTGMTTGPGQILDLGFALPVGVSSPPSSSGSAGPGATCWRGRCSPCWRSRRSASAWTNGSARTPTQPRARSRQR